MLKTNITKKTFIISLLAVVITGAAVAYYTLPGYAQSVQQLEGEINQIENEIQQSKNRLSELRDKEDTLENKLEIIKTDINKIQKELQQTRDEIATKKAEIRETERELQRKRELMQENAKTLYKEGDPSTMEILFSSDNFSDFMSRKQYLDSVKDSLNEAAREVKELQKKLKDEKASLEQKRREQANKKQELQARRNEQQKLLEKTRGEEARYQDLMNELQKQKEEAEKKLLAATAPVTSSSGGSGINVSTGDTVSAGEVIGFVGSSGSSTGPHLHFAASNGGYFDPTSKLGNEWLWPVPGHTTINPGFGSVHCSEYTGCVNGRSYHVPHRGLDFAAPWDTPVVAVEGGTVWDAGCWAGSGFGNLVVVEHNNGIRTYYPHLGSGCI